MARSTPNIIENRGLSVFVQQGAAQNARLLFEAPTPETELFVFERPEMVRNERGTFLIMPARLDARAMATAINITVGKRRRGGRSTRKAGWRI